MLIDGIIDIWNFVMEGLTTFLPTSPVADWIDLFADLPFLGYLNWFIPVGVCVEITYGWCVCIAGYYLISVLLRWVKVIA